MCMTFNYKKDKILRLCENADAFEYIVELMNSYEYLKQEHNHRGKIIEQLVQDIEELEAEIKMLKEGGYLVN